VTPPPVTPIGPVGVVGGSDFVDPKLIPPIRPEDYDTWLLFLPTAEEIRRAVGQILRPDDAQRLILRLERPITEQELSPDVDHRDLAIRLEDADAVAKLVGKIYTATDARRILLLMPVEKKESILTPGMDHLALARSFEDSDDVLAGFKTGFLRAGDTNIILQEVARLRAEPPPLSQITVGFPHEIVAKTITFAGISDLLAQDAITIADSQRIMSLMREQEPLALTPKADYTALAKAYPTVEAIAEEISAGNLTSGDAAILFEMIPEALETTPGINYGQWAQALSPKEILDSFKEGALKLGDLKRIYAIQGTPEGAEAARLTPEQHAFISQKFDDPNDVLQAVGEGQFSFADYLGIVANMPDVAAPPGLPQLGEGMTPEQIARIIQEQGLDINELVRSGVLPPQLGLDVLSVLAPPPPLETPAERDLRERQEQITFGRPGAGGGIFARPDERPDLAFLAEQLAPGGASSVAAQRAAGNITEQDALGIISLMRNLGPRAGQRVANPRGLGTGAGASQRAISERQGMAFRQLGEDPVSQAARIPAAGSQVAPDAGLGGLTSSLGAAGAGPQQQDSLADLAEALTGISGVRADERTGFLETREQNLRDISTNIRRIAEIERADLERENKLRQGARAGADATGRRRLLAGVPEREAQRAQERAQLLATNAELQSLAEQAKLDEIQAGQRAAFASSAARNPLNFLAQQLLGQLPEFAGESLRNVSNPFVAGLEQVGFAVPETVESGAKFFGSQPTLGQLSQTGTGSLGLLEAALGRVDRSGGDFARASRGVTPSVRGRPTPRRRQPLSQRGFR